MAENKKEQIASISRGIQRCRRCERAETRDHAVPGEGKPDSKIILLGEAPGKKENHSGRPFVGRAGDYLDKIFQSHSLERKSVYITSVLKCYHPDSPKKNQIEICISWTEKLIDILQPELILVMGRTAEYGLFGKKRNDGDIEVKWKGLSCIVTCHPAAAMRFPERDKQFKRDFQTMVKIAAKKELL